MRTVNVNGHSQSETSIYTSEYCKHNNILGIASEYCEL